MVCERYGGGNARVHERGKAAARKAIAEGAAGLCSALEAWQGAKKDSQPQWSISSISTQHKSWLPSSIFSPEQEETKKRGAGCGVFFCSPLGEGGSAAQSPKP